MQYWEVSAKRSSLHAKLVFGTKGVFTRGLTEGIKMDFFCSQFFSFRGSGQQGFEGSRSHAVGVLRNIFWRRAVFMHEVFKKMIVIFGRRVFDTIVLSGRRVLRVGGLSTKEQHHFSIALGLHFLFIFICIFLCLEQFW